MLPELPTIPPQSLEPVHKHNDCHIVMYTLTFYIYFQLELPAPDIQLLMQQVQNPASPPMADYQCADTPELEQESTSSGSAPSRASTPLSPLSLPVIHPHKDTPKSRKRTYKTFSGPHNAPDPLEEAAKSLVQSLETTQHNEHQTYAANLADMLSNITSKK